MLVLGPDAVLHGVKLVFRRNGTGCVVGSGKAAPGQLWGLPNELWNDASFNAGESTYASPSLSQRQALKCLVQIDGNFPSNSKNIENRERREV